MRANALKNVLCTLLVLLASPAIAAQSQQWEVEIHGGGLVSSNPTAGHTDLPAGRTFVPSAPPGVTVPPVRTAPSWFFGDGASLLNQAGAGRPGVAITPLDSVLNSRFVDRQAGSTFGVRIGRSLDARWSVELTVDEARGSLALDTKSTAGIKSSETSFLSAFNLALSFPQTGAQIDSKSTVLDNRGHQLITTGAVLMNLVTRGSVRPYVALGVGLIDAGDDAPSATLAGHYHFTVPPTMPILTIDQTDTVTVRAIANKTMTWVVGGGVKYTLSDHLGVRVDLRDHVNRDPIRTTVDASPTTAPSGALGTVSIFLSASSPALMFATSPALPSSLSGEPVSGFETFSGTGLVNQVSVAAGFYWRF